MSVKEFMRKNRPKRKSKLKDFDEDIKILIENKYTISQIYDYLFSKKVEVSKDYLYVYCRKLKRNQDVKVSSTKENDITIEKDSKKRVDPVAAYKKLKEENAKKGVTGNEVKIWEPEESKSKNWDNN